MSPRAGALAGADVLIVAEQLRRPVPGGIGTYVAGLLFGLSEFGRDDRVGISLLASKVKGSDPLLRYGFPVREIALPAKLVAEAWQRGIGSVGRASLVHATSFALPPTTAPLVVTVHDLAFLHHPDAYPARGLRWHRNALDAALRRAVAFVVPAISVKDDLCKSGAASEVVHVIEEGADHLPPADLARTKSLLDRLGVAGPFLLAVGTREPRKNLERILAAYSSVRGDLAEPLPLVVVGPSGWGPDGIDGAPGVVLAGGVEAAVLSGLYRLASLLCYVPLEEGFGLPVVEAMHAGTPVVSSDVPAAAGATQLVDPLDADSIAEGIQRVLTDDALRRELRSAGAARASSLTWRAVASRHLELWRDVAERAGS